MDALAAYHSSGSSGSDNDSETSSRKSPSSKRQRLGGGRMYSQPAAGSAEAAPPGATSLASSLLPPAAALLDGSYSPPPAAQLRALEQAVLHQGRARAFPHVTGNYATHVFIKVPTPPACLAALEELLQRLRASLPELQPVQHASPGAATSGAPADATPPVVAVPAGASLAQPVYHVSLSRTVPLRLHQIEPLVGELRGRLRQQETFRIRIGAPEAFANDDGTRTFLSLAAERAAPAAEPGSGAPSSGSSSSDGSGSGGERSSGGSGGKAPRRQRTAGRRPRYSGDLVALCQAVSDVFAAHGLPRFYEDPRPHASVAWLLGDQRQQLEEALAEPAAAAAAAALAEHPWQLRPAAIVCKAGQREHLVWQPPS